MNQVEKHPTENHKLKQHILKFSLATQTLNRTKCPLHPVCLAKDRQGSHQMMQLGYLQPSFAW